MKKEILKIAGVKSEKEFYKKFPTEEAFMKAHGKAFKKAQIGAYIGGEQDPGFQPIAFQDVYDEADYAITGMTDEMRKEEARRNAEAMAAQKQASSGGGGGLGDISMAFSQMGEMFGEEGAAALAGAKKGKDIKKAQPGITTQQINMFTQMTNAGAAAAGGSAAGAGVAGAAAARNVSNPALNFKTKQGGSDQLTKTIGKYAPAAGQLIQGIQQLREEKRALERAEQAQAVSDISLQAARTRPEETERRYVRPEDIVNTGEEFFPIYGVGTNVLARDGKMVGGNPGEIANTFAPNTLYDDLGYEPLNDSERYKQFVHGGKMHKAQDGDWLSGTGFYNFASSGGADATGQLITGITGENAGGNIGGAIGGTIGSAFGPAGKMVGQAAGQLIGSAINRRPQKIKRAQRATQQNIQNMALQQGLPGVQAQYTSFMKDGGEVGDEYKWVSHTWQPQKIMSFGGHNLKDLLKPPHDAEMLRAGGHLKAYTPPSERAMSTERPDMEEGGELQIHWGGDAEPMSYNPYLPDGGETIMFRGQSHDESDGRGNTGIGITYGENPVEVERGEPALKLQDGGAPGDSSLVVFGNLKIPKSYIPFLGKEAEGRKFKTYVADLSKKENRQNKIVDKATNMLSDFEVRTPIDKLTLNSLQHNMLGANEKLKEIADKKIKAASLQNAINDTAEEMGLVADDLAKGKVKIDKEAFKEAAKFGKMIKAQGGVTAAPVSTQERVNEIMALYNKAKEVNAQNPGKKNPYILELQKKYHEYFPEIAERIITSAKDVTARAKSKGIKNIQDLKKRSREEILETNLDEYFGPRTEQYIAALPKDFKIPSGELSIPRREETTTVETTIAPTIPITPYRRSGFMDIFGQVLPFIRPTDAEALDPNQLVGEMYALATNQLEPVQAQTMQPLLSVPYDISLQDQLNENEATFRSQQRLLGYNPAAQSMLNAQKYMANQQPLAEQFRANQAMRDAVYRDNRNILNQFGLKNLEILDRQYVRQAEAKSKTKAVTQAALNSIGDKFMRNQLENRTLQVYENLYNYRFDPRFRAINMNAPFQPQIPTVYVGPDGKQYQVMTPGIPSTATPPIVPSGSVTAPQTQAAPAAPAPAPATVPAAAPSAAPVPMMFLPSQMKDQPGPLDQIGRAGTKVSKKKGMNSSILKAFKNL